MLLLLGAAIVFLPRAFPDGFPVRGYGVMLLVGIVAGVGMAMLRAQQGGLNPEIIISLRSGWSSAASSGRLFYVIEYWQQNFAGRSLARDAAGNRERAGRRAGDLRRPDRRAVGFIVFVRKHGLPLLAMADLVAPCMAIGLRLGPHRLLSQRLLLRRRNRLPWHVTFPKLSSPYEASEAHRSAAFQSALLRSGVPRRDARISHRVAWRASRPW